VKSNIYPRITITTKATGVRMGNGKGRVDSWGSSVKCGLIMFEIHNSVSEKNALFGLRQAKHRLPFKSKIIFQN
jgi:ribosomal protein L16/L10AE